MPRPPRVRDAWGDAWTVREARATAHGFDLLLGRPVASPRGQACVIMTKPLQAYLEAQRDTPAAIALPLGNTAIKRLRALLGHHWRIDRAAWWHRRAADLADLTIEAFAARHGVSAGAVVNARHALFGPALRPAGWWRAPDVAALILADKPRAEIAESLGISVGAVGRLRWQLRRPPPAP